MPSTRRITRVATRQAQSAKGGTMVRKRKTKYAAFIAYDIASGYPLGLRRTTRCDTGTWGQYPHCVRLAAK